MHTYSTQSVVYQTCTPLHVHVCRVYYHMPLLLGYIYLYISISVLSAATRWQFCSQFCFIPLFSPLMFIVADYRLDSNFHTCLVALIPSVTLHSPNWCKHHNSRDQASQRRSAMFNEASSQI